jgi:hypothetical protein
MRRRALIRDCGKDEGTVCCYPSSKGAYVDPETEKNLQLDGSRRTRQVAYADAHDFNNNRFSLKSFNTFYAAYLFPKL